MNKTKQKKLMIAKCVLAIVFILVLIASISTTVGNAGQRKITELLNLGNKYLEDTDYEGAILAFDQAIAIDPKCEEAYFGKAQAQYALGQYEDAITTLQDGIAKVDDSSRLEEFLQQIQEKEITVGTGKGNAIERKLTLNYIEIIRFTDTREPEIQLEVLGDEGNEEKYAWESSDSKCVTVSSTGLVTCKPVEGTATIYAEDEYGNKSKECTVSIVAPESGVVDRESEVVKIKEDKGDEEKEKDYTVMITKKEGKETATVTSFGERIYLGDVVIPDTLQFSGNVIIPKILQFQGKEMVITGISGGAFGRNDKLDSIYIPATIEDMGIQYEYGTAPFSYCMNLKEIIVDDNNSSFKVENGVLYSKDGKILCSYPSGKADTSYILPKEVEKVCPGAFLGCRNLKEIIVEEGNEYYESDGGALIEKEYKRLVAYPIGNGLTSYTVPDGVKFLEDNVFYSSILEEVDCNSVEWIHEGAFCECNRLERIRGGENTTKIIWGSDRTVEFLDLSEMENLEQMMVPWSEKQDIGEISALRNLRKLEIYGMSSLKDLSWLEGMESLLQIDIYVDEFNVTDLSPILALKNLQFMTINCSSSDKKELSPDIKEQIEELKEQNPNMHIWE